MTNFQMNDKCAAGTGRFLDVMARVLEVKVSDLAPLGGAVYKTCAYQLNLHGLCGIGSHQSAVERNQ